MRIFRGETEIGQVPADDRARAYGDGLFETMRACSGHLPWWDAHWARLEHGSARLGIPVPAQSRARRIVKEMLEDGGDVVRLHLARGAGPRGYAPDPDAESIWSISVHPAPAPRGALALRWCDTHLAIQPALAGIKHCNRLEQVLARAEWVDNPGAADEGLMLDTEGFVICATSANLFVHVDGEWLTPLVDRCGVRGICRDWAMDVIDAREARVLREDVQRADAVFLCNAVRGILEVTRLGDRTWSPDPRVARLRGQLAAAHPAFAPAPEFP